MTPPTFGIEEEFLLCDAETGKLRQDAEQVLIRARQLVDGGLDHELKAAMLETGTAVCADAQSAGRDLRLRRAALVSAASDVGARVLATGSYPDAPAASIGYSDEARYRAMATRFGPIADQSLVCGCHVHVAVPDRAVAVAVIDQVRLWIAPLIALSANSPLWQGVDTGFDSWRTQVWSRWPTAGPASAFGSVDQYDRVADALVCSGAAIDRAGIYYQARVSESWPTIEVRVADVCLDVEDAVLLGLLVRALVIRAFVDIEQKATSDVPPELLRAATFAASRWGLRESLVDPTDWRRHRAGEVLQRLVSHIRAPLEECGDLERAQGGIDRLLNGATAAEKQRRVWQQGGTQAVLDLITLGWPPTL